MGGKRLRSSATATAPGAYLLAVYGEALGGVVGQLQNAPDSNQITAALELLRTLPLEGSVVTGDASPVTSTDLAASAVIEHRLGQARPVIPIISEEGATVPLAFDAGAPFWALGPLNGAREFMAGCPEFTVNIGLVVARRVHLDVVAVPSAGTLFGGRHGGLAWWGHDRGEAAVRGRARGRG